MNIYLKYNVEGVSSVFSPILPCEGLLAVMPSIQNTVTGHTLHLSSECAHLDTNVIVSLVCATRRLKTSFFEKRFFFLQQ